MKAQLSVLLLGAVLSGSASGEIGKQRFEAISAGHKALFLCSAHYIAGRDAKDIKQWEIGYAAPSFNAPGDAWLEPETKSAVGASADGKTQRRAVFREGMGCTLLAPGLAAKAAHAFPRRALPSVSSKSSDALWPNGDKLPAQSKEDAALSEALSPLLAAAFDGKSYYEKNSSWKEDTATLGVVILYQGRIVGERYRKGWGPHTQYRTYSAAKSFTNLIAGARVLQKRLDIDKPVLFPEWKAPNDPRRAITTRHLLNMSSGLRCDGGEGPSLDTYFGGGRNAAADAADRELVHPPGSQWCYANYDSISVARAVRLTFDRVEDALDFPYSAVLNKIGMRDTVLETDSYGNFILSSQIWTTSRDLARFGLLYLRDGVWERERLLPQGWVEFSRTPVPSTSKAAPGRDPRTYGAQFWLYNDHPRLPRDTFTSAGHQGQHSTIVPSRDVVVVRMGLQGWNQKDFVADVLQLISTRGH